MGFRDLVGRTREVDENDYDLIQDIKIILDVESVDSSRDYIEEILGRLDDSDFKIFIRDENEESREINEWWEAKRQKKIEAEKEKVSNVKKRLSDMTFVKE